MAPWRHEVDKVDRVGKAEKAGDGTTRVFFPPSRKVSISADRCSHLRNDMPSAVSKSGDGIAAPTSSRQAQSISMRHTRSDAEIGHCYTRIFMGRVLFRTISCLSSEAEKEGERDDRRLHELGSNPEAIDYPVN